MSVSKEEIIISELLWLHDEGVTEEVAIQELGHDPVQQARDFLSGKKEFPDGYHDANCQCYQKKLEHCPVHGSQPKCSVCGEPQIETPSGLTCKNGHGGSPSIDSTKLEETMGSFSGADLNIHPKIVSALASTFEHLPDHAAKLFLERSWGSKWGRDPTPDDLQHFEERTDEVPESMRRQGCRYFKMEDPSSHFPSHQVSVVNLLDLKDGEVEKVKVRVCEHDVNENELYIGEVDLDLVINGRSSEAWLIVFPEAVGEDVVDVIATWYPGPVLGSLPPGSESDPVKLFAMRAPVAVKVE